MRLRRHRAYKSGFSGAFSLLLFLAIFAATGLLTLVWPWLAWPLAPGTDQLISGAAAVLAVLLYIRQRRSPKWRLQQDLREAAGARAAGTWLNRDEHQVFMVSARWWPWCRLWLINRLAEDSARELERDEDEGEVPLPVEVFAMMPFTPDVVRHDTVMLVDPARNTARELPGPGVLRSAWRLHKTSRKTGFGFITADPAQIAEVVTQLRGSELISGPEED